MNKPQIQAEINRLVAYLKERRLNLPSIVFEADHSCKTAAKALDTFRYDLSKLEEKEVINSKEDQKRSEAATKVLDSILDDLEKIGTRIDKELLTIHASTRARLNETRAALRFMTQRRK